MRRGLGRWLLLGAVGAMACGGGGPSRPVNVVVIVVDALRADHLGCYGYPRPTSPHLDALAARGTRFAAAFSPAPWTLPAMATAWTGLLPAVHGAREASDMNVWIVNRTGFRPTSVLDDSRTTLAEVLRDHGFATAAFVGGSYPSAVFGMAQGFQEFVDEGLFGPRMQVEALWEWLDEAEPARFFAYLHMMSVHSPYQAPVADLRSMPRGERGTAIQALLAEEQRRWADGAFDPDYNGPVDGSWANMAVLRRTGKPPPARDLEHLVALYDQGIRYTDHWIGEVAAGLAARGLSDSTVMVVTADHGEELGDHGALEHSHTFYDEVMRVPLVIVVPGEGAGRVVTSQVGLVDLFPTVLDLLAVPYAGPVQGISLRPAIDGQPFPERDMLGEASQVQELTALRTSDHKYVTGRGGEELYDLRSDPRERQNLCVPDPSPCRPFADRLAARQTESAVFLARAGLPPARAAVIDAATRQRLRALGYH